MSASRTPYPITAVKWPLAACCVFFILSGALLIPYAGIQNDEALFSSPLYGQAAASQSIRLFHHNYQTMLMSYLGTLKSALYSQWFRHWRPGVWSLRLPVLLIGAVTIWLFGRLLQRTLGARAAVIGAALLATDTSFLLTTVFDWGPVALQHLLTTGGVLALLAFAQENRRRDLALGFFLFGLAMWDKALAAWMLGGLGIATLAVFPRELFRRITSRNLLLAVVCFAAGALPLIVYNVKNPMETFRGNAKFSTAGFLGKADVLRATLDGSSLFGYIMADEWVEQVRTPATTLERLSTGLRDRAGERRRNLSFWALLAAIALVPLWWPQRRAMFFALTTLIVAWLQMAFTRDAGGGTHHSVLLWPWPAFVITVVLSSRRHLWTAAVVLCGASLLVSNQHLSQLIRQGTCDVWTDAISPLARALPRGRMIAIMDWGMFDALQMLDRGQLHLVYAADLANNQAFNDGALFVAHAAGHEVIAGIQQRVQERAASLGLHKVVLQTIADRNGRTVFEISEYRQTLEAAARR